MKTFARNSKKSKKSKNQLSLKDRIKNMETRRLVLDLVILACVILLGVTAWLWWTKIVMNPDRVLQGAIENSLQTNSVTKHITQEGGGNSDVNQTTYLSFYPPNVTSQSRTVLSQGIGSTKTSVTTETIGTNDADYVRYTEANNTGSLPGAERLNDLFGKWAKRSQNPTSGDQVTFLNESIYGIFAFGNLDDAQRSRIMELVQQKNVYKYQSVERRIENKRPVYVYELSINPVELVSVIREYLEITGAGDPSQLNPDDYKGAGRLQVIATIDILSRQLLKIEYPTGRVESYNGHNLYKPTEIPSETMPVEELQRQLQGA